MIYSFQMVILIIYNQGGHQHPRGELSWLQIVISDLMIYYFIVCEAISL